MTEITITYESLYEILRTEKYRKELQDLDESFFLHLTKYLGEKTASLDSQKKKDSIFAVQLISKTAKELENIRRIIKDLYEIREKKIIEIARLNSKNEATPTQPVLIREEQQLYNSMLSLLTNCRQGILQNIIDGKHPEITHSPQNTIVRSSENKLIRFVYAVPKFLAEDEKIYGPYEEGDVANLPERAAKTIIKAGRAETI